MLLLLGCGSAKKATSQADDEVVELSERETFVFDQLFLDGLKQKSIGRSAEAEKAFERCLAIWPNHPPTLYELAQLALQRGAYIEAVDELERAVEGEPDNRWYRHVLAKTYEYTGEFASAASMYEQLLENNPNQPEYYFDLGHAYARGGESKKAINAYDQLEKRYGVVEELSLEKHKLYLALEDVDGAAGELEKLIEAYPLSAKNYIALATLYKQEGQLDKAGETYKRLEAVSPDDALVLVSLYDYYVEIGDTQKADKYLKLAFGKPELSIDTKVGILLNLYGQLDSDPTAKPLAFELLGILEETHPNNAKTFAVYGDFFSKYDMLEEARDKYKKSIALDRSRYSVWNQMLLIEAELGQMDSLLVHATKALELFPAQPTIYFFKGIGLQTEERYEEAAEVFESGRIMVVGNPALEMQFYINLAECYYRLGDTQKTWMNFDRALRISPENYLVLNNYAYYLSLEKRDLAKAVEMSAKVVEANPSSATYLDTHAWVLYQLDRHEEAETYMSKALEGSPNPSAEMLEHYGDILVALDRREDALRYYQDALALESSDTLLEKIESLKE